MFEELPPKIAKQAIIDDFVLQIQNGNQEKAMQALQHIIQNQIRVKLIGQPTVSSNPNPTSYPVAKQADRFTTNSTQFNSGPSTRMSTTQFQGMGQAQNATQMRLSTRIGTLQQDMQYNQCQALYPNITMEQFTKYSDDAKKMGVPLDKLLSKVLK